MQLLEHRIMTDGEVLPGGILKVDGFLNHQMDPQLLTAMGEEFHRLFAGSGVNKILTIEASGIGPACFAGLAFGCPVLFGQCGRTGPLAGEGGTGAGVSVAHRGGPTGRGAGTARGAGGLGSTGR